MKLKIVYFVAFLALMVLYFPRAKSILAQVVVNISATIAPHYELRVDNDTLWLETNMHLMVNGLKIR